MLAFTIAFSPRHFAQIYGRKPVTTFNIHGFSVIRVWCGFFKTPRNHLEMNEKTSATACWWGEKKKSGQTKCNLMCCGFNTYVWKDSRQQRWLAQRHHQNSRAVLRILLNLKLWGAEMCPEGQNETRLFDKAGERHVNVPFYLGLHLKQWKSRFHIR